LKLLLVDDSDLDAILAVKALRQAGHEVSYARVDTAEGMEAKLLAETWDAVICDHQMPHFDSLSALRLLHSLQMRGPQPLDLPMIIVSGVIPDSLAILAMREGARDFVSKGTLNKLPPVIEREIREAGNRALLRQTQASVDRLLNYDMLTGVFNTDALIARLNELDSGGPATAAAVLLLVDINRFRALSQALGLMAVNRLLRAMALRLSETAGRKGFIARVGSDRFAILLDAQANASAEWVGSLLDRFQTALTPTFELDAQPVRVTCCLGAVAMPADALGRRRAEEWLRRADAALMAAKAAGPRQMRQYQPGMGEADRKRMVLETALFRAIADEQFEVYYQPQIRRSGETLKVVGVEALLRWNTADRGVILPGDFVPLLEASGLIVNVGNWVLAQAANQWAVWNAAGLIGTDGLRIAVNLSALQFAEPNLADGVAKAMDGAGMPARWLELELTESIAVGNEARVIEVMNELKQLGCALAIDDFGTGYSSLAYLQQYPIDRLKIDRRFVQGDPAGKELAIAQAVVAMGKSLGMSVIAEGVETEGQAAQMVGIGCDEAQGFLFARPMPAEAVTQFLARAAGWRMQ
jgi:diguanylate cyclase (GGDEF)-like protein